MSRYTSIEDVQQYVKDMERNSVLQNRDISVMRWNSPLDNYRPVPRDNGAGFVVKYRNNHVEEAYVLFHDDQFGDSRALSFLIDDGETVKPFYLASWNESGGFFILHPIQPGIHDLGPRKTYHVKVNSLTERNQFGHKVQDQRETVNLTDFPYVVHAPRILDI